MLAEVNISKAPLSQRTHQPIVSKLLTYTVWHRRKAPCCIPMSLKHSQYTLMTQQTHLFTAYVVYRRF